MPVIFCYFAENALLMEPINIRLGQAADLPAIHQLVGELAEYEKARDQFIASLEDYQQAFADQVFETIVAEKTDGKVIGMMLYYLTYSTWKGKMMYLEDFVVREPYRRHGIGQRLFEAFLDRSQDMGCTMVKWQVLDWNDLAINFYKKYPGVVFDEEWHNCKITF